MRGKLKYVPHKLRSHPFRCLLLPWILIFLVILYWFSLVPILYTYYISQYNPTTLEKFVFLGSHFLIFIVILALLVCLWKINPVNDKINCDKAKIGFSIYEDVYRDEEKNDNYCDSLNDGSNQRPQSIEKCVTKHPFLGIELHTPNDVSENFPDGRPLSQNLEVSLTPRELFFLDLYENAYKSRCTITRNFLEKEKEYWSQVLPNDVCEVWKHFSGEVAKYRYFSIWSS